MAQYTPKRMMASTPAKSAPKKSTPSKTITEKAISNIKLDKNENLSIRPIENGFIVSESGYTGKGKNQQWFNREYYSQTNPIKFGGKK